MSIALYQSFFGIVLVASLAGCSKQEEASPASVPQATQAEPASTASAAPTIDDYEKLEAEALKGDYQAQRNISYWLSGGVGVPPVNPILGCAWRIVVLNSGSLSVDQSDSSNKTFYCDKKLTPEELRAAQAQSETLIETIAKNRPN